MPKIQTVLSSGGTSPKDFTLHDAGHSFRVAQRMERVASDAMGALSPFELSLLLLSAYLHDIGMTPEVKKVDAHFNHLLTAKEHLLTDNEIDDLQMWLDDNGYQVVPPISDAMPLADRLSLAREISTYYCRDRHNDWGAEWIRANLSNEALSNYSGWIEDLISLCQSHHFGLGRLMQSSFRARRVAEPPAVVNLRFLALVLRLADILEFDPERTPEILLRHRDISPESQIYWWKDKEIVLTMADGKIVITARPSTARLHKAIEETASAIDAEMTLCRKAADDSPLGAIPGEQPLCYPWALPSTVHRDIEPREGTYEYIDGAFRPDTEKLLSLLSGTSLYQTPLHAVRELVQNAFDAVAERIAYLRLAQVNPASVTLAEQLAEQHRVTLSLEIDGSDAYLVCTDNGIGMTKAVIQDRVLVAGSSPRHDVRALDRRCREAGFDLGRSGQFGIGILSYFMIATNVEMETLRALEAGDSDFTRWHFETGGIGSFGELRKLHGDLPGTRVRLRLRPDVFSNPKEWYENLRRYLENTLVRCPCEFYLSSPLPACEPLEFKPGWTPRDYAALVLLGLRRSSRPGGPEDVSILSSVEREERLAAQHEIDQLGREIRSSLRWRTEEAALSDNSAHYVIGLPYFQLGGDASLAFLRTDRADKGRIAVHQFLNGTHFAPKKWLEQAWKGMAARGSQTLTQGPPLPQGSFFRINWTSDAAGEITAGRDAFLVKANKRLLREFQEHWEKMLTDFLEESKDSKFAWLNERIANLGTLRARDCQWLRNSGDRVAANNQSAELHWGKVDFPAISRSSFGYLPQLSANTKLMLNKKSVLFIPWSNPAPALSEYLGAIGWNPRLAPPDRVVYLKTWYFGMAPIWLRRPKASPEPSWIVSKFPPQWRELCGAKFHLYAGYDQPVVVWNRDHPLVREATTSARNWCDLTFQKSIDPVPHREEILSDPHKAAYWLLQCIRGDSGKVWRGLPERDPKFLPSLFSALPSWKALSGSRRVLFWADTPGLGELRVVDPTTWTEVKKPIEQYLPNPGTQWSITGSK